MNHIKQIKIYILAFIIVCGLVACDSNFRTVEQEIFFRFNPNLILESIKENKKDLFVETSDETNQEQIIGIINVESWNQSDYLRIVDAAHQFVWSESITNWKISFMSFALSCEEIDYGFQSAIVTLYKKQIIWNEISTIEHEIHIQPKTGLITVWEFVYDSLFSNLKSLNIAEIKTSADQALLIAEKDGGTKKRLEVNNVCDISVSLAPSSVDYEGWRILYSPNIYSSLIDLETGIGK